MADTKPEEPAANPFAKPEPSPETQVETTAVMEPVAVKPVKHLVEEPPLAPQSTDTGDTKPKPVPDVPVPETTPTPDDRFWETFAPPEDTVRLAFDPDTFDLARRQWVRLHRWAIATWALSIASIVTVIAGLPLAWWLTDSGWVRVPHLIRIVGGAAVLLFAIAALTGAKVCNLVLHIDDTLSIDASGGKKDSGRMRGIIVQGDPQQRREEEAEHDSKDTDEE